MDTTTEKAYGKLNISLDVVSKRDDGYHEMCMVMQSVSFCDDLAISLNRDGSFGVSVNLRYVPSDDRNIAIKAARAFGEFIGDKKLGTKIDIKKRVPVCAGMGGGSSDAAAVLRALNRMTNSGLTRVQLEELGATLGSDVPFCVAGGTALATGRGEVLTEIAPFPDCVIVICKPRFSVSTPKLFERLDGMQTKYHPDTSGLLDCIGSGDLKGASQRMFNVFEDAIPSGRDHIAKIKGTLLENGAYGAVMTGTGSAIFGVFDREDSASTAAAELQKHYREVFITVPQRKIILD